MITQANSEQLVDRLLKLISGRGYGLLNQRPDSPTGLLLTGGVLTWEQPKERANITHYNIYDGQDTTLSQRVPVDQVRLEGMAGTIAFIASYNHASGLEGIKVSILDSTAAAEVIDSPVESLQNSDYTLTNTYADTGPSITLNNVGIWCIRIFADCDFGGADTISVRLLFDGAAQPGELIVAADATDFRLSAAGEWHVTPVVTGKVVKMQAKRVAAVGSKLLSISAPGFTKLTALLIRY